MQIDVDIKSFVMEEVNKWFEKIPRYVVEIGIFHADNEDKRLNIRDEYTHYVDKEGEIRVKKRNYKSDITNAEIMFVMEYGSPTNHIPPRPVLQKTIDYAKKKLLHDMLERGAVRYFITGRIEDFEQELEKMCLRMETYAKAGIRRNELGLAPNSKYTIKKKGSDVPLLDTGQLSKAIQCRWRRVDSLPTGIIEGENK